MEEIDLPNLETKVADLTLSTPIMNAAGTCRSLEELQELARSQAGAVMVGSITMAPREGNKGNVFSLTDGYSLNSLGMPNLGAEHWREMLRTMAEIVHSHGKPFVVSIAGNNPDEYAKLAELVATAGADGCELNFGCPNLWSGGQQKRIMSFDLDGIRRTFHNLRDGVGQSIAISAKYSPYSDPTLLEQSADAVCEFGGLVQFLVTMNTVPNTIALNPDGTSVITPQPGKRFGYAGLAGPAVKPIALGQVAMWRDALTARGRNIPILGAGGIETGQDMLDFMHVGANAVQINTAYWRQKGPNSEGNPAVFGQILAEYVELKAAPKAA